MGLQKRYTLTTFSVIGYLMAIPKGRELAQQYVVPLFSDGIQEFEYKYREAPLSDWPWPITICCGYLVSVFLLKAFMENKKEWNLKWFRIIHNIILCFGSFIMVLGMIVELYKAYQIGGVEALVCDSKGIQHEQTNLYNWYYIFFLSKFYEFLDTYVIILRKKPTTFLHVFHHFITAYLCWLGLYDKTAIQWTVIALNGTVHVFMYYYYLAVSFNSDLWWKKYLTTMQIVQFCVDIVACIPFFYNELVLGIDCSGTSQILGFSNAVLVSFLILFINFFMHAYKPKEKTKENTKENTKVKAN